MELSLKKILIQKFLKDLAEITPESENDLYENPYAGIDSIQRYNLEQYLTYMLFCKPKILLVGEAPGYKGCQKTGIPFVSEAELRNAENHIILGNWQIRVDQGTESERSAKCIMAALRNKWEQDKVIPLIWNAFPFHPYQSKECIKTNRTPTKSELKMGRRFIDQLKSIYEIDDANIYAIGRRAQHILDLPEERYIRHPSHGGQKHCLQDIMTKL